MLKILIAEDDVISRKLLKRVLSEYGECDLVINGVEALDAFMLASKEKEYYDLICLDIMMPKIDGLAVLRTIRELEVQYKVPKPTRVIMVTALSESEVVNDAFHKGADAYAPKPIDIDRLIEVLEKFELV